MITGNVITAHRAIGDEYDRAIQLRTDLRMSIASGKPRFTCTLCGVGVYLNCMHFERRFYFKHAHEDGSCPIQTRGDLTQDQIDAIRYNGVKESRRHQQMKEWIRQGLASDCAFSDIIVEGNWTGALTGERRRPDVRASYQGMPVVFEVQLSSTYLNVIAERRVFYLQEGALLIWVFAEFDDEMRKLTQDDVFFTNNQNGFVVSSQTAQASAECGKFMMEVVYRVPLTHSEPSELLRKLVGFNELILDQAKQQAYFYDYYGQLELVREQEARDLRELEASRKAEAERRWRKDQEQARAYFQEQWLDWTSGRSFDANDWQELVETFDGVGLYLPDHPGLLPGRILNALYSLKHGYPIGWAYKALIEVAHVVLPGQNREVMGPYLDHFWRGARAFGRVEEIQADDRTGKWKKKVEKHRGADQAGDTASTWRRSLPPPHSIPIPRAARALSANTAEANAVSHSTHDLRRRAERPSALGSRRPESCYL